MEPKKWYQSSNFWNQVVLLVASALLALNFEFPVEAGKEIVGALFSLFAGGNIVYHVFRDQDVRGKFTDIFKSSNFWANALTVVVSIFPMLPISDMQQMVDAILAGRLELILVAAFNLLNVLYKLFFKKTPTDGGSLSSPRLVRQAR